MRRDGEIDLLRLIYTFFYYYSGDKGAEEETRKAIKKFLKGWFSLRRGNIEKRAGDILRYLLQRRIDEDDISGRSESGSDVPNDRHSFLEKVRFLPPRERSVLILKDIIDLPDEWIIRSLKISKGTFITRLNNARLHLVMMKGSIE